LFAAGAYAVSLFMDFQASPSAARLWCYWYWVNDNVEEETPEGGSRGVKRIGFGDRLLSASERTLRLFELQSADHDEIR